MHHPLAAAHDEGVILLDFQIVHQCATRHNPVAGDHTIAPIGPQDVHSQLQLRDWHEAFFLDEEGMLLVGVNGFACRDCHGAV